MENIDFGKSANQIWKESGSTLSFNSWIQREKDKGRFLPNKKLMEFNSIDGQDDFPDSRNLIKETIGKTLEKNKTKNISANPMIFGLNKFVIIGSVSLIIIGIAYKIYEKQKK